MAGTWGGAFEGSNSIFDIPTRSYGGGGGGGGSNRGYYGNAGNMTTGGPKAPAFDPAAWGAMQQQKRYDDIMPMLKQQFNNAGNGGGGMVGGFSPGQGHVSESPIWSQQQIQENVNAMRGNNDMATQGHIRDMNQSLAGRGFTGGSPLSQALSAMYQGQNLATNTEGERGTRWDAAQGNAQHVQRAQIANAQGAQGLMGLNMDMRRAQMQQQNQLLSALAGLI